MNKEVGLGSGWRLVRQGWRAGSAAAFARLLPRLCLLCEAPCDAATLCPPCRAFLPGARRPRCRICARPWQTSDRCATCRDAPPAYDASITAADYTAPLDRAITTLKFGGRIGLASGLGGLLAAALTTDAPAMDPSERMTVGPSSGATMDPSSETAVASRLPSLDCIVPIPLARERLAQRGFNQARLIAASMLRRLPEDGPAPNPPLRPALLARQRDTTAQSLLAWNERQANLDHGFVATADLAGLRIGVVDDVMTTGATLQAAALALKAAGAARVVNLVVARTA